MRLWNRYGTGRVFAKEKRLALRQKIDFKFTKFFTIVF